MNVFCLLAISSKLDAEIIYVESQIEFDYALAIAEPNDSIIWRSGTYQDIIIKIEIDHLYFGAEESGNTIFTGH